MTNPLAHVAARIAASSALASTCLVQNRRNRYLVIDTVHRTTRERITAIAERLGATVRQDHADPSRLFVSIAR